MEATREHPQATLKCRQANSKRPQADRERRQIARECRQAVRERQQAVQEFLQGTDRRRRRGGHVRRAARVVRRASTALQKEGIASGETPARPNEDGPAPHTIGVIRQGAWTPKDRAGRGAADASHGGERQRPDRPEGARRLTDLRLLAAAELFGTGAGRSEASTTRND